MKPTAIGLESSHPALQQDLSTRNRLSRLRNVQDASGGEFEDEVEELISRKKRAQK